MKSSNLWLVALILGAAAVSMAVAGDGKQAMLQDIIILDPGGGRMNWKIGVKSVAPGLPGVLRDDLVATPVSADKEQRLICTEDPDGNVKTVTRMHVVLSGGEGAHRLVEIVDPGNAIGSGLIVRVQGAAPTTFCAHDSGCVNSGIPSQLYGTIVPGSAQFYDGTTWYPVTETVVFDVVSSSKTSCSP